MLMKICRWIPNSVSKIFRNIDSFRAKWWSCTTKSPSISGHVSSQLFLYASTTFVIRPGYLQALSKCPDRCSKCPWFIKQYIQTYIVFNPATFRALPSLATKRDSPWWTELKHFPRTTWQTLRTCPNVFAFSLRVSRVRRVEDVLGVWWMEHLIRFPTTRLDLCSRWKSKKKKLFLVAKSPLCAFFQY